MDDEQPLSEDTPQRRCCLCQIFLGILSTRRELQRQKGCGCLGYHPKWMQKLADIRLFVVVICYYWLLASTLEYYLVGVLSTLEKRFGYSSAQSGALLSIRETSFIFVTTFVSHFARNLHRPRFLAIVGVMNAVGGLLFSLPHFMFDRTDIIEIDSKWQHSSQLLTCQFFKPGKNSSFLNCNHNYDYTASTTSYGIFVISSIIIGIAATPVYSLTVTYVDDSAGPKRVAVFLGFIKMMRPLGPVLGFLLGGLFTSKYETLKDPGFDQDDSRWVGAWWIGYIVIPLLLAIPTVFLPMFPQVIKRDPIKDTDSRSLSGQDLPKLQNVPVISFNSINGRPMGASRPEEVSSKDFLSAIRKLLKNPVYVTLLISSCFSSFAVAGFFTFLPKYFEVVFHLSTYLANVAGGGVIAIMAALGTLMGGLLSSRLKWSMRQSACYNLVVNVTVSFMIVALVSVKNPGINLVKSSPANSSCLDGCHCLPDQYHPVCGEDRRTYVSPCHAGCSLKRPNETWSDCACVEEDLALAHQDLTSLNLPLPHPGRGGSVVSGVCTAAGSSSSYMWVRFTCILALSALLLMSTVIPATTIYLSLLYHVVILLYYRGVEQEHRAVAFGFAGTVSSFFSFVPGPLVYGALIDSTCDVWTETCQQKGECLIFDLDAMRVGVITLTFGGKLLACVGYFILWLILRKKEKKDLEKVASMAATYYGGNSVTLETASSQDPRELRI